LDHGDAHTQRGISPGSRSNPSNPSGADGGHIAGYLGKGGSVPASFKRDSMPVVGENREVIDDRRK
jgi:hypothetical protein